MNGRTWWATVCGVSESGMAERTQHGYMHHLCHRLILLMILSPEMPLKTDEFKHVYGLMEKGSISVTLLFQSLLHSFAKWKQL